MRLGVPGRSQRDPHSPRRRTWASKTSRVSSAYFVVGYWVPCVFTLFALGLSVSDDLLPATYRGLGWEAKALVLGAIALLTGLALLGLRYPLTRILEGYWPEQWPLRPLKAALTRLQARSYDKLVRIRDENIKKARAAKTKEEAATARPLATTQVRLLDRKFHSQRGKLLPTRFGNAYRAFENYPYTRYGLDMIAIWPRIDALLSEQERELHTNAASDLAFFMNSALGAVIAGVVLVADWDLRWWWYLLPFVLSYVLYRASVGAAERVGTERRASIDLHRLELYKRLGVRRPTSAVEERAQLARAVNRFLLWGEEIPSEFLKG
jgi:hypothetical protein